MNPKTVGVALFINIAAIVWTTAMLFNSRVLGQVVFVSLNDTYVDFGLMVASAIATIVLSINLFRRASEQKSPSIPVRQWDAPCPNCGTALSRTMQFCTACGHKNAAFGQNLR